MNRKCKVRLAGFVLVLLMGMTACSKDDSYRIIKLTDMDGEVSYTRDDETEDVYENMNFESGDEVETEEESRAQLTLDSDKILTMGAETTISMEAEGDEEDSETRIKLEEGEITCEIKNALSSESLYEVETSNAIIGVRGTIFYVKAEKDRTLVYCEKGQVEVTTDSNASQTVSAQEAVVVENDTVTAVPVSEIVDEVSDDLIEELPGLEEPVEADSVTENGDGSVEYDFSYANYYAEWILDEVDKGQIETMPDDAVLTGDGTYMVYDESSRSNKYYHEDGNLIREWGMGDNYNIERTYTLIEGIPLPLMDCYYSLETNDVVEVISYVYFEAEYCLKEVENNFAFTDEASFKEVYPKMSVAPGKGYALNIYGSERNENYWLKVDVADDGTYTITIYK